MGGRVGPKDTFEQEPSQVPQSRRHSLTPFLGRSIRVVQVLSQVPLNLGCLGVAQRERKRGRRGGLLVTGVVGEDELYLAIRGQIDDFQGGGQSFLRV